MRCRVTVFGSCCLFPFREASDPRVGALLAMTTFLAVSMYMDEETAAKYFTGNAVGINNKDFTDKVVPFAPKSKGEKIALKKFARAHRAEYISGPPVLLITIKIPADAAMQHFVDGDIKVMDRRPEKTIGFTKAVNIHNYPSMLAEVTQFDLPGTPEELLSSGYELLG